MTFPLNENKTGYWEGMPPRLRSRVYFFAVYYLVTGYFAAMGHWWGYVLVVLPAVWWVFRIWLLSEVLGYWSSEQGLVGYTVSYAWGANVFIRSFMLIAGVGVTLFALGWFSTEDLRAEWAEPTLAERALDAAAAAGDKVGEVTDATAETGKGWLEKAKGWFD